jgi:hypothetical protein
MQAQYVQPQLRQPGQPTMLVAQPPQPTSAASPMPVELRAVPSPTTAGISPTAVAPPPRMRFPSFTLPSTWFTPQAAPSANQQLIGYMVPGPNGTSQMVSVEQMQAMSTGAEQPPTAVSNSDGFRPRAITAR